MFTTTVKLASDWIIVEVSVSRVIASGNLIFQRPQNLPPGQHPLHQGTRTQLAREDLYSSSRLIALTRSPSPYGSFSMPA